MRLAQNFRHLARILLYRRLSLMLQLLLHHLLPMVWLNFICRGHRWQIVTSPPLLFHRVHARKSTARSAKETIVILAATTLIIERVLTHLSQPQNKHHLTQRLLMSIALIRQLPNLSAELMSLSLYRPSPVAITLSLHLHKRRLSIRRLNEKLTKVQQMSGKRVLSSSISRTRRRHRLGRIAA